MKRARSTALGAVLAGAALLAYQLYFRSPTSPLQHADAARPELRDLVRSIGAYRPLEARLTGGFSYGAIPESPSSPPSTQQLTPDARIAFARIEKSAIGSGTEREWAALGSAYLVTGDLDRGAQLLEASVAAPVPNPFWLSDLSAAYLSLARRQSRPELLPKALAAAERAVRLNGRLQEALFNRALALEALHLTDQAEAAWKTYHDENDTSPWGQEALAHRTRLAAQRTAASSRWESVERALPLDSQRPTPSIDDLRLVRYRVHTWIETYQLPLWAQRELAGQRAQADEQLGRARQVAEWLVMAGGDPMPRDAIRAIEAVVHGGQEGAVQGLARAHLALRDSMRRSERGDLGGAADVLASASEAFGRARSPYLGWVAVDTAGAQYVRRQFDAARLTLNDMPASLRDGRYPLLAGRRRWLSGLISANEGRLMSALADYRFAYETFHSSGELEAETSIAALLAEVYEMLGVPSQAWRYEVLALDNAARFSLQPARRVRLYNYGGFLCSNEMPEAGLHFQNAVLAFAGTSAADRPTDLVTAFLTRAQTAHQLGDDQAAREDLRRAAEHVRAILDGSLRDREEAELLVSQVQAGILTDPASAVRASTRAIEYFNDSGGRARMVPLYLARGRAHEAARELLPAEDDFSRAIRHFEEQRNEIADRQLRASFFHDGSRAFAEMARFQTLEHHDAVSGLEFAERGRARTLLEGASNSQAFVPLPIAEIQRRLPGDVAVLFYLVLDERLLVWAVRRTDVSVVERPIGAVALRTRVDRLRWLLTQPGLHPSRIVDDLKTLAEELIDPVRSKLGDVKTLAIVPDGPLHALPFSALLDRRTGHFLVQDFVVTIAPSLSLLVRRSKSSGSGTPLRALVIGNPARNASADDTWIAPLPFSDEESHVVAATYSNALLLTGERATKQALLQNLSHFNVIHYGGHAVVNEQTPSLSRLLLAPSAAGRDDGTLFMTDLSTTRLDDSRVVVLAACSTAAGSVAAGEGIQNIARPFLEAGAATVVATLWDVEDRTAAELFQQFHRFVADGENAAAALALTQRHFIERSASRPQTSAQWAWAVAIGAL